METDFFGWKIPLEPFVTWPIFFFLCGLTGFFLGHILRILVLKFVAHTTNYLDDIIAASFGLPVNFIIGIMAVVFAAQMSGVPGVYQEEINTSNQWVKVLIIFLLIIGTLRFVRRWIDWLGKDNKAFSHSVGIIKPLLTILVLGLGTLIILTEFKVDILPILTGLGVGGIAVALALQSPLSNFFAGVTLVSDRQIKQGDFIHLDNGLEGWVQSIGWRSTLVMTREHQVVIIPNLKLSESIITNFYLPKSWIIIPVSIGVSYSSDPQKVEDYVLEEVRALSKEKDFVLLDPPPTCRFHPGFGDSSLDFTLRFAINSFEDTFEARDSVRKRIFNRFRKEGIEIPFPQRDLHIKEGAAKDLT